MEAATASAPHFSSVILWLIVLFGAVMVALASTILDNRIKNTHRKRPHNNVLLLNECLAEHQSAYVIYFTALAVGSEFSAFWVKPIIPSAIVVGFVCYIVGVSITADHEEILPEDHLCNNTSCRQPLRNGTRWRILRVNVLTTLFLLALSIMFALYAVRNPAV